MTPEIKCYFRDQLRDARNCILKDSEAYESVVLVLERMGRMLSPKGNGLGSFTDVLVDVAHRSPLAREIPALWPSYHLRFNVLFKLVREGRNTAVHEGALARHLTNHALDLALILEDALMEGAHTVAEYMVRGPVTAQPWHPLSFVRQTMLANSFSYLPVFVEGKWHMVADMAMARFLLSAVNKDDRTERLGMSLEDATKDKLQLELANTVSPAHSIDGLLPQLTGSPFLVVSDHNLELLGILSSFDLL